MPRFRPSARETGRAPYHPMTMFDSMALRARSRSVPVCCMYRRMAWTLSPEALAKQSRAVKQGSLFPVIPSADLEMTHVSRGGASPAPAARGVTVVDQFRGSLFVVRPGNDDMGGSFDFEQRHGERAFLDLVVKKSATPRR